MTSIISDIKIAKLTATILHQYISEYPRQCPLFIINNYTLFVSFYAEGIADENVLSRRFQEGGSLWG